MDAEAVFRDLFSALEALGLRFAVGGSYASGARGHPRQTNDLDILLDLPADKVEALSEALNEKFDLTPADIVDAVRGVDPHRSFQLLHFDAMFKIDVFLGTHRRLVLKEMERAVVEELLPNIFAPVLTAEDIVIEKILWYQLGNRVSDRQWNDLVGVIEVQGPAFDREYMLKWAKELGVLDLAEEALAEAKEF